MDFLKKVHQCIRGSIVYKKVEIISVEALKREERAKNVENFHFLDRRLKNTESIFPYVLHVKLKKKISYFTKGPELASLLTAEKVT